MGRSKGDRSSKSDLSSKTWGAEEVHDWGLPPPPPPSLSDSPSGIASVSDASGGGVGISPLLFQPASSTPLERDEPEGVPAAAWWAMADRKHTARRPGRDDDESICVRLGSGDHSLYVVDDGPDHCMICRFVGADPEECVYCLVARIDRDLFADLRDGRTPLDDAFSGAHDIALCSVFESQAVSNVVHIAQYRRAGDVPAEYLPPSPFIPFTAT
ncbi:MAG TPA: hypothetical protein VKU86_07010 [Acidimicrobiales bacterium]|nr:hypothetical protein [Acidimicrobiales bacterium]